MVVFVFFFFQAEDGIRDIGVTGVQTCALPISRHNTRFDAARVGKELAQLAQGFACYKAIGDAMGRTEMSRDMVSDFFKDCLEIPRNAKREDISTRKANQFQDLSRSLQRSVNEGAPTATVLASLQEV